MKTLKPDDNKALPSDYNDMKWFAATYPDFPILQVGLAKFKDKPISQAALTKLANGKKTIEVSLISVLYFRNCT